MPINYLRGLTGLERTEEANRRLARYLSFVAGAVNAGGYLAVRQYTSHMSGIVSAAADNLALGKVDAVLTGFTALPAFLFGAGATSLIIRSARRHQLQSEYALPLAIEAGLLVLFGLVGHEFRERAPVDAIILLCFTMGLQNAMITKISGSVIRTTHLTGMVTDLGIELGRGLFATINRESIAASMNCERVTLLSSLIALFFLGGLTGALGFRVVGFLFTLPLAAILLLLALIPILDDLRPKKPSLGPPPYL